MGPGRRLIPSPCSRNSGPYSLLKRDHDFPEVAPTSHVVVGRWRLLEGE